MDEKLKQLGLEPYELTAEHKRQLDEDGFTIFDNVISDEWLHALRQSFEQIYNREGAEAGKEVAQMEGVRRLADLVNKGEVYDQLYLQPFLLATVGYVMQQPFKLHSVNGHDPLKDSGQQALHADWPGDRTAAHVVNSMWMLDDFTQENGATRIVPASHRDPRKVAKIHPDRKAPFPGEVRLVGKAGSVGVFNGNAWHSSSMNLDGKLRRTVHCAFIARQHPQQTDRREYLTDETAARLSPLARHVLDVEESIRGKTVNKGRIIKSVLQYPPTVILSRQAKDLLGVWTNPLPLLRSKTFLGTLLNPKGFFAYAQNDRLVVILDFTPSRGD